MGVGSGRGVTVGSADIAVAVGTGMDAVVGSGVVVAVGAAGGTSVGVAVAVASPPQAAKTSIATRAMPIATYLDRCAEWLIISPPKERLYFTSHCP